MRPEMSVKGQLLPEDVHGVEDVDVGGGGVGVGRREPDLLRGQGGVFVLGKVIKFFGI